jgi:hypothetical protein
MLFCSSLHSLQSLGEEEEDDDGTMPKYKRRQLSFSLSHFLTV